MPFLILIVGVLIGLYALYRFFISASVAQVKALFLTGLLVVIGVAVLILSLTGRLPAAIAVLAAVIPVALSIRKSLREAKAKREEEDNGIITLSDDDVEDVSGDDSDEET